jgi:hypothetical protein
MDRTIPTSSSNWMRPEPSPSIRLKSLNQPRAFGSSCTSFIRTFSRVASART